MPTGDALLTGSGKMEMLDRMIGKLKNSKHKVLIFSQYVKVLRMIELYLNEAEYVKQKDYVTLTGSVGVNERQGMIEKFNKSDDCFLFLLSTRAGGVGINLQAANVVILFDPDWNPQMDLQAICRAHRIGQLREVKVFRFFGPVRSVEQYMLQRTDEKLDLARMAVDLGEFSNRVMRTAVEQLTQDILNRDERDDTTEKFTLPHELNKMMANSREEAEKYDELDNEKYGRGWQEKCLTSANFVDHLIAGGRFIDEKKLEQAITCPPEDECRDLLDLAKRFRMEAKERNRMYHEDLDSDKWRRCLQLHAQGGLSLVYPGARVVENYFVRWGENFDDEDSHSESAPTVIIESEDVVNRTRARAGLIPLRRGEYLWSQSGEASDSFDEERWAVIAHLVDEENYRLNDALKREERERGAREEERINWLMKEYGYCREEAGLMRYEQREEEKALRRDRKEENENIWMQLKNEWTAAGIPVAEAIIWETENWKTTDCTFLEAVQKRRALWAVEGDAAGISMNDLLQLKWKERIASNLAAMKFAEHDVGQVKTEEQVCAEREVRVILCPPENATSSRDAQQETFIPNLERENRVICSITSHEEEDEPDNLDDLACAETWKCE